MPSDAAELFSAVVAEERHTYSRAGDGLTLTLHHAFSIVPTLALAVQ